MKKYHIADVLTFSRFVFGGLLIFFTIMGVNSTWVLIVFTLAEMTDALDGITARSWHYPKDGKKRWWRKYAVAIDQIADIFVGLTLVAYIMFRMDAWIAYAIIVAIVVIAIPIQIWRHFRIKKYGPDDEILRRVVLTRRYAYILVLYALFIYLVCYPDTFGSLRYINLWLKALIIMSSMGCMFMLMLIKQDRLIEDKTPLERKPKS